MSNGAGVSLSLVAFGALGGLAGGFVAVWLAKTIPQRMELNPRLRSSWWRVMAIVVGGLYGWMVALFLAGWAVLPAFLLFGAATLALGLIDLDHQLIPNRVLFPALGVSGGALVIGALADGAGAALLRGAGGAASYFAFLLAFALIARGGFGMGDVKLALLLGLFLGYIGWGELVLGAVLAVLLGGVASAVLLVLRRKARDAKFAYGPYLIVGAWIAIIWGERILDWYLR